MDIGIIDIILFIVFLIMYYYENIKNKNYQLKIDDLKNELNFIKIHISKLEKNNESLNEKINDLNNENIKIKSNITEIKNDVEIKNRLFLNSIKFLKTDLENIIVKQNKYIQYIYYYFGNKEEDKDYFKFFIATNKLYDYFNEIKSINEQFFSKSFKEFINNIRIKK